MRARRGPGPHQADAGIQVVVVDAEDVPAPLPARRADGGRWMGAWLVVRRAGSVAGLREVSFSGRDVIGPEEVASHVRDVVGQVAAARCEPVPDDQLPPITVVVPTNVARPAQLRECLLTLQAADYPDVEVVVVDNRREGADAQDPWPELTQGLDRVRIVRQRVPGISAARNAGIAAADGDIIAFTDDDVRVDPAWLRALGSRFAARPDEDAVCGLILPAELATSAQLWFERHYGGFGGQRIFRPQTFRGRGPGQGIGHRARVVVSDAHGADVGTFAVYGAGAVGAGANMAFRASTLARLGGFDEALGTGTAARGGEDLAMFVTLLWEGGVIGYDPAAVVFHTHREGYADLRRQLHSYGLGFTAMLTSLVLADSRHLLGVASQSPAVVRALRPRRRAGARPTEPALGSAPPGELRWLERAGLLRGPGAYLASRWSTTCLHREVA